MAGAAGRIGLSAALIVGLFAWPDGRAGPADARKLLLQATVPRKSLFGGTNMARPHLAALTGKVRLDFSPADLSIPATRAASR